MSTTVEQALGLIVSPIQKEDLERLPSIQTMASTRKFDHAFTELVVGPGIIEQRIRTLVRINPKLAMLYAVHLEDRMTILDALIKEARDNEQGESGALVPQR